MFTLLPPILVTLAASRAAWLVLVIGLTTHIQAAVPLITFGGPDADVARGLNVTLGGISRDGSTVFGALDTGGFFWNSSLGSAVQPLPRAVKFSSLRGDVLAGDTFIWTKSAGTTNLPFAIKGLSSDGSTLFGQDAAGGVRWTNAAGVQRLDFTPTSVSGSGSVIAGIKGNSMVRWTSTGQTTFGLPRPPYCDDALDEFCGPGEVAVRSVVLSRDGNRIAGTGDPPQGSLRPYNDFVFWTLGTTSGPDLGQGALHTLDVMSADGKVGFAFNCCVSSSVVHTSRFAFDQATEAFQDLGGNMQAVDASFDGSAMLFLTPSGGIQHFGYWDSNGPQDLLRFLQSKGVEEVDPNGFLNVGTGTQAFISDNGFVIASDVNPWDVMCAESCRPATAFWLVNLAVPEPSALMWFAVFLPGLFVCRQRQRALRSRA